MILSFMVLSVYFILWVAPPILYFCYFFITDLRENCVKQKITNACVLQKKNRALTFFVKREENYL